MKQHLNKHLMMFGAALAIVSMASCNKKEDKPIGGQAPVVTEDMFTVKADVDNPKVVHFDFLASGMQPSWDVERSNGENYKTNDAHFSLTYSKAGTYNGTVMAYNSNGTSKPFPFSFDVDPGEAGDSEIEKKLMAHKWKVSDVGNSRDGNIKMYGGVNEVTLDDEITFNKDYTLTISRGETPLVYNDRVKAENWVEYPVTGKEGWVLIEDGELPVIEFTNGGFPLVLKDENGINSTYTIETLEDNYMRLVWKDLKYEFSYFIIDFAEEGYVEPEPEPDPDPTPGPTPDPDQDPEMIAANAALLTAHQWVPVAAISEEYASYLSSRTKDDVLTFNADGSFILDLGANTGIYVDDGGKPELTATGEEKWELMKVNDQLSIVFTGGGLGFPGAMGDMDGNNALWEVRLLNEDNMVLGYKKTNAEKGYYFLSFGKK